MSPSMMNIYQRISHNLPLKYMRPEEMESMSTKNTYPSPTIQASDTIHFGKAEREEA